MKGGGMNTTNELQRDKNFREALEFADALKRAGGASRAVKRVLVQGWAGAMKKALRAR
jgi:hypothetical protein